MAVYSVERKRGVHCRTPRPEEPGLVTNSLSKSVLDLVGPVTLEALERDVHAREVVARNAADLLDRSGVFLVHPGDDPVNFLAPLGQADAHRAPVDA